MEKPNDSISKLNFTDFYLEYIKLRKIGLKKRANQAMQNFIRVYLLQPLAMKREFIDLVYRSAYLSKEDNLYLPYNLYQEALLPELDAWKLEDPGNPIPFMWSRDLVDNKKAIQLSPDNQLAIQVFSERVIKYVSMNQHEITAGFYYDGNPEYDLELIEFCEKHIHKLNNPELKDYFNSAFFELKTCAIEWKSRH